ncbi:hypothetical protein [Actinomyces sp. HMT897]|uniref:hypothetical protein n=1 Tax=Actinomyces sp. HMT897 TaxID=2789424 RepID=UPI00190BD842|nr:hypothetical protein [Actinomyces sp. HMT897]QQO77663.1 hypothetical protein JJJ15_11795 [Actinomyces sp. HMT897]
MSTTLLRRDPAPAASASRSRRRLLALALVSAALVAGCDDGTTSTAGAPASSTAATTESGAPAPGGDGSPTAAPTSYDAPQDAASLTGFWDPDEKNQCSFLEDSNNPLGSPGVVCQVNARTWSPPAGTTDIRGNACDTGAVYLVATPDKSGLFCFSGDLGAPSDTLTVGQSAAKGDFACTATSETALTCWSTTSGASFAFSPAGWMTGTTGPIPESAHTF